MLRVKALSPASWQGPGGYRSRPRTLVERCASHAR